jgi:MFS family permease
VAIAAFRPLRNRNFALVFSAALVSNVGSWMQTVAVGILVTEATGQAQWTGLVAAAAFLPVGLLAPVGGAMADRYDRRRFLLWTTVAQVGLAALLALISATGHATPAAVTLVVLAEGAVASLGFPAYQAMLPQLVEREDLLGAISLGSAQFNLGRIVGPALAGIVVSLGSFTWAFAVNAASFLAVVVALLLVRLEPVRGDGGTERLWARIRTGARSAWGEPGCRTAIALIAAAALLASPFIALIPAFAQVLLGGDGGDTSVLVTAQGVGAVAGALALAPVAERFGRRRLLMGALVAVPVALLAYAAAPSVAWAAAALVAVGVAYVGILSGLNTVVQVRAPEATRARVLSLWMLALGTLYPVGAVLHGWLADLTNLRVTTAGGAVLMLGVVAVFAATRPDLVAALDDPRDAEMLPTAPAAEPGPA